MERTIPGMRHVVDWRAAVLAGLLGGLVFLITNMVLTGIVLGTPWVVTQIAASPILGADALPPPNDFEATTFIVGLLVTLVGSVIFGLLLALILHRWGLVVGLIGGALLGLVLYGINFYTASLLIPWFFLMRSWMMLVSHILYGAAVGVIYEAIEEDVYVPVEA